MKQAVRAVVTKENQMLVMKRNKFGQEYYTLVGGAVEVSETLEAALRRELLEETQLKVGMVHPIFTEDAGAPYGVQFVFWCEYLGGEPVLSENTPEYKINMAGKNTYEPVWVPIADLAGINFVSGSLKEALLYSFQYGFPKEPQNLNWKADTTVSSAPQLTPLPKSLNNK